MRNVTWQRELPAPPVPAQTNDSLSTRERGSIADDESTSDRGDGGVVDELDDDLAHLNDLDATWSFDLNAFLQERREQVPITGDAGDASDASDEKAETIGSSQGRVVDASSAPAGRAESETIGSSQRGAMDAFSAPRGRAESDTIGSSQGGAVDASSVPAERAESGVRAASISGIGQGNGEDLHPVLSERGAHGPSDWGLLLAKVRGRTWGQTQRLEGEQLAEQQQRINPEV